MKIRQEKRSILVIDDDEMNLEMFCIQARHFPVNVQRASSGQAGLELLKRKEFDLVFLDYYMPEMNGMETLVEIQQLEEERNFHVPVILLTGKELEQGETSAREVGFAGIIKKPIRRKDIGAVLADMFPEFQEEEPEVEEEHSDRGGAFVFLHRQSIDYRKGLKYADGDEAHYQHMIEVFIRKAQEGKEVLPEYLKRGELQEYSLIVHSLKNHARGVGDEKLGTFLENQEIRSDHEDFDFLRQNLPAFMELLEEHLKIFYKFQQMAKEENKNFPEKKSAKETASIKKEKVILAVDDEEDNLEEIYRTLGEEYEIVGKASGEEALSYLKGATPDLMLLDVRMPNMNGMDLLKKVRTMEGKENTLAIFLTSFSDTDTEDACFELGAVDFIGKPFEPKILRRRVRKTFELAQYEKRVKRVHPRNRIFDVRNITQEEMQGVYIETMIEGIITRIPGDKILYVEVYNNDCLIRTKHKEVKMHCTLKKIETQLGDGFLRVGQSFLINYAYIERLRGDILTMENGKNIKLPRRKKKELTQAIMNRATGDIML